jgi:hypothetical protein
MIRKRLRWRAHSRHNACTATMRGGPGRATRPTVRPRSFEMSLPVRSPSQRALTALLVVTATLAATAASAIPPRSERLAARAAERA